MHLLVARIAVLTGCTLRNLSVVLRVMLLYSSYGQQKMARPVHMWHQVKKATLMRTWQYL